MTCKNMFPMKTITEPSKSTILSKINKTGSCWLWGGEKSVSGYGHFEYKGLNRQAHRLVWTIFNGEIPGKLFALHKCRRRDCVNPDHLYIGTQKENTNDRRKDGTISINRAESHPLAKLNWEKVGSIRKIYSERKQSQYDIALRFGVTRSAIQSVIQNKTWRTQ